MSALRWPAYTDDDIAECLRLAFASSPLAQPPEANLRCRFVPEPQEAERIAGVTCSGDERYDDRTTAPEARR